MARTRGTRTQQSRKTPVAPWPPGPSDRSPSRRGLRVAPAAVVPAGRLVWALALRTPSSPLDARPFRPRAGILQPANAWAAFAAAPLLRSEVAGAEPALLPTGRSSLYPAILERSRCARPRR